MDDIYHFKVWKEYSSSGQILAYDDNLAFMMHMDFVHPFRRSKTKYSMGVLYLTILNLPRKLRFRKENIIVLGLIPGPKEPTLHINGYLEKIVEELNTLYESGLVIKTKKKTFIIRAILIAITADLPAMRKLLSFLGTTGLKGCSKCEKNMEEGKWRGPHTGSPNRTHSGLKDAARHYKDTVQNQTQDTQHAKEHFARWNPLYKLSYWNMHRFHLLDGMHNLFLGLVFAHLQYLKNQLNLNIKEMDLVLNRFIAECPNEIGRLPTNLFHRLKSAKAVELKNFALYFSLPLFQQFLPPQHFACWRLLVLVLQLLCSPTVNETSLGYAQLLLMVYLARVESLMPELLTINFHMSIHLRECMLDYGPIHVFWWPSLSSA